MVEQTKATNGTKDTNNINYERQPPKQVNVKEGQRIYADYNSRKLDYCHFCGEKYNVGARIPRILVHCGHTFCTECLSNYLFRNFRVRCPICKKLVKNLETPERLPLNINVLYEVVERDPLLSSIDFDDESPEAIEDKLCIPHNQRIMHFYCSNHRTIFCRECIQVDHTDEKCFVVDLYEIEKMRKLQGQNITMNKSQLSKRKDGATVSCVVVETYKPHVPCKPSAKNPSGVNHQSMNPSAAATSLPTANAAGGKEDIFDYGGDHHGFSRQQLPSAGHQHQQHVINHYDYGNEELMTDEARTNEEEPGLYVNNNVEEQLHYHLKSKKQGSGNTIFFNGEEEGMDDDDDDDSEEEEDGQFVAASACNASHGLTHQKGGKMLDEMDLLAYRQQLAKAGVMLHDDEEEEEEY